MPGVPNEHLPGRGITDLTSRGRYQDDVASMKRGLRISRSIEERLSLLENAPSDFLWSSIDVGDDYEMTAGGVRIRVNTSGSNIAITLPPSSGKNGQMVSIIKFTGDANTVTIAPSGADFLGVVSGREILSNQWEYLTLVCINQEGTNGWDAI